MTERCCTSLAPCDLDFQDNLMGAESEGVPQQRPPKTADEDHKRLKVHRLVKGGYMEWPTSHWLPAGDPKIRKIKSSKMWTDWSVNKNNGLQDETPKLYIHGCRSRRTSESCGGNACYEPDGACPNNTCPCPRICPCASTCLTRSLVKPPKAFFIEYCVHGDRRRKRDTSTAAPLCPRPRTRRQSSPTPISHSIHSNHRNTVPRN